MSPTSTRENVSPYLQKPLREKVDVITDIFTTKAPRFDASKALAMLSQSCETETDAQLRVIEAQPLLDLAKALIEQAREASLIYHDSLADAAISIQTALDELPDLAAWEERQRIEYLTGDPA